MALGPRTRLGPYEIQSAIGAGGMGEVYKARDTRLKRDVAIKILPELFAADPERVARFQREAEVLASLNHPNIAAIYGLEEAEGVRALIMELVEGEALADRIARGPIPIDETLPIARQIAEALEAAHGQGIIHRDLKPANIRVRPDGTVKVLDFGLAKLVEAPGAAAASPAGLSMSPTMTSPALVSGAGVLLGTAAYMSPEQARGKPADKRGDIWAFGCVVFEMLTGQRAFPGVDVTDTIAAIVRAEPEWARLPGHTPGAVHTLLQRCLAKDPNQRLRDVGDALFDLDPDAARTPAAPTSSRLRRGPMLLTAVSGIAIGAVVVWPFARSASVPSSPTTFVVDIPQDRPVVTGPNETPFAIAPNGRFIVYVAGSSFGQTFSPRTLMIRRFDSLDAQPLFPRSGDVQPRSPFVSADSTWVGFISDGSIMKVPVTGGTPVSVCECDAESRGGAAWLADGTIVYNGGAGLKAVSADGRDNRPLTKLDVEHGESEHLAPAALPGRDEVLLTAYVEPANRSAIHVVNLTSGARRPVLTGAVSARYFASGFLAYLDASSLLHAIRFDAARSETSGEPIPIGTLPIAGAAQYGGYDVSDTGTLVYLPGQQNAASRRLVWVSRDGKEQDTNLPRHAYLYPRFSPDGESVALDVRDAFSGDLWLWDVKRDTLSRLTSGAGRNAYPAWTPDGRNVLFVSSRTGSDNIYRQAADGSGAAQALTNHPNPVLPYLVSPDGTMAVLRELMGGNPDLALLRLTGTPTIERLIYSRASDVNADLSPDGHWIVYQSDQSGVPEIYVQPFPDVGRGRWQISNGGGLTPLWARSGREIFFVDPGNNLIRVEVQPGASFSVGKPSRFFAPGYSNAAWTRGQGGRSFDLTPDGQRFLVVQDAPAEDSRRDNRMNVVLNWQEQLKRIGPTH